MSYRGRAQYGQNYRGRLQYNQNYTGDSRRGNFRGTQNYRGQNFRDGYRGNFRNDNFGRGRSRSRDRQYSVNFRKNEKIRRSRSRSGLRVSANRDTIRCFKFRECDHFAKDGLNVSDSEKEKSEQIEQMLNLEEDKKALKVLEPDTY